MNGRQKKGMAARIGRLSFLYLVPIPILTTYYTATVGLCNVESSGSGEV